MRKAKACEAHVLVCHGSVNAALYKHAVAATQIANYLPAVPASRSSTIFPDSLFEVCILDENQRTGDLAQRHARGHEFSPQYPAFPQKEKLEICHCHLLSISLIHSEMSHTSLYLLSICSSFSINIFCYFLQTMYIIIIMSYKYMGFPGLS